MLALFRIIKIAFEKSSEISLPSIEWYKGVILERTERERGILRNLPKR